ncbi:MAG TPA: cbb3-type cytochrome oxidase assembly protein CcoS [Phycisphaeraceae bacterium]|nr:cbb3-type cytochrome oxidase assembly protein CcoS [Phycisphaeraceae bacterium]
MDILFVVLPAALLLALIGVLAFVWAVRSGQLDDLETPAMRILEDDDPVPVDTAKKSNKTDSDDED